MLGKKLTTMELLLILFLTTGWKTCFGYQISQCGSDGKVDLDETGSAYLTCTGITDDSVKWTFNRDDGHTFTIGACTWSNSSCLTAFSVYEVKMTDYSTSTLTVTRNHRNRIAGTVVCGGIQNTASALCKVRVVYKADKVSNCSVSVNDKVTDRDWTVTASCDVKKMYASDGQYSCYWVVPNENGTEREEKGSFSSDVFVENKTMYYRGTCSISNLPMPTAEGSYKYDVIVNPGNTRLTGPRLEIEQPGEPTLSNCTDYINEGDNLNCTCQTSDSSPPAVTTWFSGIISNNLLQLRNVSRSPEDFRYTCIQYWGGPQNNFRKRIDYRLRVIYVPESQSLPAIAGGVGGVIVVVVVIITITVVVLRRRKATKKTTSTSSPNEETHLYANQAAIVNNDRSDDNEDDDFGNYIEIISNVDDGEAGINQPALAGDSTYQLPTRRSQVVDTNIYTGLDPQSQGNDCQETETTQYQNTATQQPMAQEDTRRALNQANKRESTDQTDYEIL